MYWCQRSHRLASADDIKRALTDNVASQGAFWKVTMNSWMAWFGNKSESAMHAKTMAISNRRREGVRATLQTEEGVHAARHKQAVPVGLASLVDGAQHGFWKVAAHGCWEKTQYFFECG